MPGPAEDLDAERERLVQLVIELRGLHGEFIASRREEETLAGISYEDPVFELLNRAEDLLKRGVVELCVFGLVNRGKSTLVNALLGREVSSMRVTPETAVPVWIEAGKGPPRLVLDDGTVIDVGDIADARNEMNQRARRRRRDANEPIVVRVIIQVADTWLPDRVRIIDTPGLGDPSLVREYEELTLAEIERVSASMFVVVSPPGIEESERRLLVSMAKNDLDKQFFVCNFHSRHWDDPDKRDKVVSYVTRVIHDATGGESPPHLHQLNARQAWEAMKADDDDAYSRSGIQALREEVKAYLASGPLQRQLWIAKSRIGEAAGWIESACADRVALGEDPSALETARAAAKANVDAANVKREKLVELVALQEREITAKVTQAMTRPFDSGIRRVGELRRRSEAEGLDASIRLECETAVSRSQRLLDLQLNDLREHLRLEIRRELETESLLTGGRRVGLDTPALSTLSLDGAGTVRKVGGHAAAVGGATAVGGALLGGSLAGGLGIALIASGPVGWLIGAGIGAALGLLGGAGVGAALGSGAISSEQRSALQSRLAEARSEAVADVRTLVASECDRYVKELDGMIVDYRRDKDEALERVERFMHEPEGRIQFLSDARGFQARAVAVHRRLNEDSLYR